MNPDDHRCMYAKVQCINAHNAMVKILSRDQWETKCPACEQNIPVAESSQGLRGLYYRGAVETSVWVAVLLLR